MAMLLLNAATSPDNGPGKDEPLTRLLNMAGSTARSEASKLDRDWLLTLATSLQTTLDLQRLLDLFGQHTAEVVAHEGIELDCAGEELVARIGARAVHACTYDVVLQGQPLGTLTFFRSEPFSDEETRHLEDVLANLVHPLKNALLYQAALRAAAKDPLTGVANRTHLDTVLEREVELARRHGNALALLMADLDHFKRINDRFGHPVGDRTLKAVADCLIGCARVTDMVFRYGGEEFCVVLSNTHVDGALRLGERIRRSVEALRISTQRHGVRTTVSIGVAALEGSDSHAQLLEKADAALYHSKRRGRNRVSARRE